MSEMTEAQRKMLGVAAGHPFGRVRNTGIKNRTAEALSRRGLVTWEPGRWFGGVWRITDAGREAIKTAGQAS